MENRCLPIPTAWKADFILMCEGHSMEPTIQDGDAVAIHKQPTAANGQIAAVRIDNEVALKKVYLYPDRLELRPINPDYEIRILYGEEINTASIEGRAVGLYRRIKGADSKEGREHNGKNEDL